MSKQSDGISRKEFMTAGAAVAGAAAVAGFVRPASAAELDGAIHQTAEIGLNPEKKDDALAALTELVAAVEANEPGVLAYICHVTQEDEPKIFFYEIYKDDAALASHSQQPHMAKIRGSLQSGALKMPLKVVKLDRVAGFHR